MPVPLENYWLCLGKGIIKLKKQSFFIFFKQKDGCSTFPAFFCDHRQLSIVYYLLALFKKKHLQKKHLQSTSLEVDIRV